MAANSFNDSISDSAVVGMVPEWAHDIEFCVFGVVYAHPDKAEDLAGRYREVTRMAADEPDTVYYCISRDTDDPVKFYFFERYRGIKGFASHVSTPFMKTLFADNLIQTGDATFAKPV